VIAVDTNVLVHAHRQDAEWHAAALRALTELAASPAAWALPWPCIHEFLAVVTHPRIFQPPTPLPAAIDQVRAWLESPSVVLLAEADEHFETLARILTKGRVSGPRVHDARIAALCREHGVAELWSADRDFSRFSELTVRNPLA
jgi:toxin-antitoxin system PIN domain toxin